MNPNYSRLVVMISGSGTNLQAILDACGQGSPTPRGEPVNEPKLNARVVGVFSNQPDAYGLVRAAACGVPTVTCPKPRDMDRAVYDANLAAQVAGYAPDWVILAGWMRLLSAAFLSHFPGRVINLHPALPGTFPGTHAIQRAHEAYLAGETQKTGVMVHFVPDEGVDTGPTLAVEEVLMDPRESLEDLEIRIHAVEHRLLVSVIRQLTTKP
jgi:formyltetrahydrofolate-dependent phosphoribosylglycinamide formyltransferase